MERHKKLYEALKRYWGYESFRPSQLEVIDSVMAGRDTLALMPTGGGKSLLYQLPGVVSDGVCIVVTPLISLMKDQTDRLRRLGINAASIHGGLTQRQIDITLDNATWGDVKFLYLAPERLASSTFRERLRSINVSLIAVDEVHCISQWGYDFRPSYLRIAELRDLLPNTSVLALTASATPAVMSDILHRLRMSDGKVVRSSFARRNLSFAVRKSDDKMGQLLRVINNVEGCGIVYTRTRESTTLLHEELMRRGVSAEFYHGGLTHSERSAKQEAWSSGRVRVMVATNAFGMGIDKADVRFVVHFDTCDSLEAYYQEAGRAGRDGSRAYALLLASSDDRSRAVKRFETEFPPMATIKECYEQLFNHLQVGIGDGKYESFNFNLYDFARRMKMYTGTVYNSLKILQQNGYLTLTDEADNPPRIMFIVNRDDLYKVRIERAELDNIIRTLLRLYTGLFHFRMVSISVPEIAQSSGYTPERVHELLQRLWQLRIIKYIPGSRSPMLILNEERLPISDVFISPESYKIRKEMSVARIEAMYSYVEQESQCRSLFIQHYFGDESCEPCGVCDVCIEKKKNGQSASSPGGSVGSPNANVDIYRDVIELLRCNDSQTTKQLIAHFSCQPQRVLAVIDELMIRGEICHTDDGKIKIIG